MPQQIIQSRLIEYIETIKNYHDTNNVILYNFLEYIRNKADDRRIVITSQNWVHFMYGVQQIHECIQFAQNIGGFKAIDCIVAGISGGLAYIHFPDKRGLVSGITIGGYGFGSFIFNYVCKDIANPDNEKPNIIYQEDGKDVKYFDDNVGD